MGRWVGGFSLRETNEWLKHSRQRCGPPVARKVFIGTSIFCMARQYTEPLQA